MAKKAKTQASAKPTAKASDKRGKRGSGEGTVVQRTDGRWMAQATVPAAAGGKTVRKSIYGRTQAEVIGKLAELRQQIQQSPKSVTGKDTVGGYLTRWLEEDIALNRAAKTHLEYQGVVFRHIVPYIGHVKLTALDGEALVSWQAKLAKIKLRFVDRRRRHGTDDIRRRTVKILTTALNRAVKLRLIPYNPCAALTRPKVRTEEVRPLEPSEVRRLCKAAEGFRLGEIFQLAVHTGLRRGELFALQWQDINLREGVLCVRHTLEDLGCNLKLKAPKTESARRMVPLTPQAIEAIQRRLENAKAEGLPPEESPMVFPSTTGGFIHGSNFDRRLWHPVRKAAGLPDSFSFHGLRHTFASLMLAAECSMKTLQVLMGHRDFQTTANTYSHLLQNSRVEAIEKFAAFMAAEMKDSDPV